MLNKQLMTIFAYRSEHTDGRREELETPSDFQYCTSSNEAELIEFYSTLVAWNHDRDRYYCAYDFVIIIHGFDGNNEWEKYDKIQDDFISKCDIQHKQLLEERKIKAEEEHLKKVAVHLAQKAEAARSEKEKEIAELKRLLAKHGTPQ